MKKNILGLTIVFVLALFAMSSLAFAAPNTAKATKTPMVNAGTLPATRTPKPTRTPKATKTVTVTPETSATPSAEPTEDLSAAAVTPVPPGTMTSSVLLYNPDTSGTANTTLHVYDLTGAEVYSTTKTIPANGAVVIPMPASLPSPFRGSAMVASDKQVQAMVLNANAGGTARDIYEGSGAPSTSVAIPVFRHLGNAAQKSIIAVQNTDASTAAAVTLHYFNADGTEGAGSPLAPVNVPPLASTYFDSMTLFGTSSFSYTVRVDSTTNVAAAEQVLYMKDTASVRGLTTAEQGTTLLLNNIERKMSGSTALNWSEIYVRNNGGSAANVTVTFYLGSTGAVKTTLGPTTIPPNGYALFSTRALTALSTAFTGYAKVTSDQSVAVEWLEINSPATTSLGAKFFAYNGVPSTQYSSNWVCGNVWRKTTNPTQYTTLKIVNVDTATANLSVKLFLPTTGAQKVAKTYTLAAGRQLSIALNGSAFSGAGTNFNGMSLVQSTNGKKIVVTALTTYGANALTSFTCNNLP
jgi:hypothetical protein